MQKNNITNKITPCCGLPFSVIYWWVSNLTLNSEADRQYLLTQISQSGFLSIDGWKVLVNSGTLEADASLTKAEFLAWFDCGKQPKCEQLKLIIEGYKVGNWDYYKNSIEELNEAFQELENNLQIGGRNLITKLPKEKSYPAMGFWEFFPLSEKLKEGETYILNGTVENVGGLIVIGLNNFEGYNGYIIYLPINTPFVANNEMANRTHFSIANETGVGTSIFKRFKLEKGNKATDWTPAPEDKQNRLQDVTTNIGVGKPDASATEKLDVNGNVKATAFYESSLRKLKENILPFESSGLGLISQLEIVTYDRKDGSVKDKIGIIADDSPEEFLSENRDSVDLYKTVFIQAKAIQELKTENDKLREELNNLR